MMHFIGEACGVISSACFIACSIPQVIQCVRSGHGKGINHAFMIIWIAGEFFLMAYAIYLHWNLTLFLNAFFNAVLISVILRYIYWPRINSKEDSHE